MLVYPETGVEVKPFHRDNCDDFLPFTDFLSLPVSSPETDVERLALTQHGKVHSDKRLQCRHRRALQRILIIRSDGVLV